MELLSPGILSVLVNILIKLMAVESLVFAPLPCRPHEASSSNGFRRRVEKDQWYFKFAKESIDCWRPNYHSYFG